MQVSVLNDARPALLRAARQAVSALYLEVAALITVASGLDLWRLAQNGWANPFYSAAVRSMSSSSHDFLYGSFDPSGVMTVDKPPLALWVQTLSVEVFGFHPLSILVPSALMGVATVVLVYDLVRRRFGRAAGFVAGLAFATTPITVAMSRHNNPDALLTLCCTAALWCVVRGMDRGRTLWVVLAGVCVGLGFETKLVEAFVVVPGIVAAWLWVARRGRWTAVRQLLQAGAATVAVGFAWPLVVALTPAADRPWISGTSDNSVWSLIGGYNGVSRLDGSATASTSGAFRLLDASVGGQVGWLLGFGVVGAVAIAAASRLRRDDPRTGWLLLVGGPFAAAAIVFSSAKGIFHPYYTVLMAPFTAALVGAGAVQLVRQRAVAALAVGAGALVEVVVIHNGAHELRWLVPLLIVFGLCLAVGLVLLGAPRARAVLVAAGLAGLLVAPSIWAVQTVGHPTSASDPTGGPVAVHLAGAEGATGVRAQQLQAVLRYVRRHGGATLAVPSQETAAPPIIATGAHVAGIGGYSGVQSNPSVAWFAQAVRAGRIRWVYFTGSPGQTFRRGPVAVLRAVTSSCQPVQIPFSPHPLPIYDCASRAALAALSGRSH
jgi:4-amino-4-deoxy-L-arabinose transferase-like glycosyltransferase